MNQHYRRFSLDYYLECQEKLGVENIEFWLGASHFYVDSKGYEAIQPVRKKLQDHHIKVVSVTTPSCAYQYQYASQEKEILEESFRYFCNGLRVGAELGADRAVVNSGWERIGRRQISTFPGKFISHCRVCSDIGNYLHDGIHAK